MVRQVELYISLHSEFVVGLKILYYNVPFQHDYKVTFDRTMRIYLHDFVFCIIFLQYISTNNNICI
jgi:hypothetical protein